jgi:hypothetical protein
MGAGSRATVIRPTIFFDGFWAMLRMECHISVAFDMPFWLPLASTDSVTPSSPTSYTWKWE